MRKIILKIKQRGYFIEIPNTTGFRTPGILDITRLNISDVMFELKKLGIDDFIISSFNKQRSTNILEKVEKEEVVKEEEERKYNDILNKMLINKENLSSLVNTDINIENNKNNDIKDILTILKEIKNKIDYLSIHNSNSDNISYIDDEIEEDELFIPKIDLSDFNINSSDFETSDFETDESLSDTINKLKNIENH